MNPNIIANLIIGGDLEGLLTANLLQKRGETFLGLAKSARLSDEAELQRLYDPQSLTLLKNLCPEVDWIRTEEGGLERKKGEWHPISDRTDKVTHYAFGSNFFSPQKSAAHWMERLADPIKGLFKTNFEVTELFPTEKRLIGRDGSECSYEKLYWCLSLHELARVWKGDKINFLKSIKKLEKSPATIYWDLELSENFLPSKNSVLLPIRHKDHKLQAIGVEDEGLHWSMAIDNDDAEDREEVAKYVRSLKREIFKELPELKSKIKNEKIVFSTDSTGEDAVLAESLELAPGLYYVGSELGLSQEELELLHLDRTIKNCMHLNSILG